MNCAEEPQPLLVAESPHGKGEYVQWMSDDGKRFFPAKKTVRRLKPGVYEPQTTTDGLCFAHLDMDTEGLVELPDSSTALVIQEIVKFWDSEQEYALNRIAYKRGILLYGPPGGGKTSTIKLIIKDLIGRQGVVIKFSNASAYIEGMRLLRSIQPSTPVVVLMEDMDAIIERYSESNVINALDGVEEAHKVVFLATTNYPERLCGRIINRPSRFDKRFRIGMPSLQNRRIYLAALASRSNSLNGNHDVDRWAMDTEGLSIAHLKELFVSVAILQNDYAEVLNTLKSMRNRVSSNGDEAGVGFQNKKVKARIRFE